MPENIHFDETRQLIWVTSVGETCIEEWRLTALQISHLIQKFNVRCVLIDVRGQTKGPEYRLVFNFGVDLLRLKNFTDAKFAIVVNGFSDIHDLLIRTTTFRGLNFKLFDDERKAIQWLKLKYVDA